MTDALWWIVGLCLAMGTAALIVSALPHAQERAVLRFQNSVGVALPAQLGEALRRRMLAQHRGYLLGGMTGVTWTALSVSSGMLPMPGHLAAWVIGGGTLAGGALGVAAAALLSAGRRLDDRERYARATAVTLSDFLAPIDRWLARLPVVFTVAVFTVSLVGVGLGWTQVVGLPLFINGGILTAMAVAALIVFEVAVRRIVSKSRPVGSREELVWDDAFRSQVVRELRFAPFMLGFYGLGLTVSGLGLLSDGEPNGMSLGVFGTLLVCSIIALWAARVSKTRRHFLRRLWPELAAEADNPHPVGADA